MTLPELFEMLNMSLSAPLVSVVETWAAGTPFNTPANETLFFFCWPCLCMIFVCINISEWRMWLWCLCRALISPRMTVSVTYDLSMIRFNQEKKNVSSRSAKFCSQSSDVYQHHCSHTACVWGCNWKFDFKFSVTFCSTHHISFGKSNICPKKRTQKSKKSTEHVHSIKLEVQHVGTHGCSWYQNQFTTFLWLLLRLYSCLGMRLHRCRTLDHISEGKQFLLRGHKQPWWHSVAKNLNAELAFWI